MCKICLTLTAVRPNRLRGRRLVRSTRHQGYLRLIQLAENRRASDTNGKSWTFAAFKCSMSRGICMLDGGCRERRRWPLFMCLAGSYNASWRESEEVPFRAYETVSFQPGALSNLLPVAGAALGKRLWSARANEAGHARHGTVGRVYCVDPDPLIFYDGICGRAHHGAELILLRWKHRHRSCSLCQPDPV